MPVAPAASRAEASAGEPPAASVRAVPAAAGRKRAGADSDWQAVFARVVPASSGWGMTDRAKRGDSGLRADSGLEAPGQKSKAGR